MANVVNISSLLYDQIAKNKNPTNSRTYEQKVLADSVANQLKKSLGIVTNNTKASSGSTATNKATSGTTTQKTAAKTSTAKSSTVNSGDMEYTSNYGSGIKDTLDSIENFENNYKNENVYQDLLNRAANHEDFSYDPETDPNFSAYRKAYLREGDRASANAIAQAAAMTGGIPSSFAQTAGQQAANYYAGKLADAIPELRRQAQDEHSTEFSHLLSSLDTVSGDRQNEKNWLLQYLSSLQGQDATDYSRFLDKLNAAYQRERDVVKDEQQAWDNAIQVYQLTQKLTGPLADYMKKYGVTNESTNSLAGLLKGYIGGGGGGRPGGGGSSGGSTRTLAQVVDANRAEGKETVIANPNGPGYVVDTYAR